MSQQCASSTELTPSSSAECACVVKYTRGYSLQNSFSVVSRLVRVLCPSVSVD